MMKIRETFSWLDEYSLRARVYPGLIAASPILVFVLLSLPRTPLVAIAPVAGYIGTTFLLANIVRDIGKRLEQGLIVEWDGLPTTRALRHREARNTVLLERRRRALEQLLGGQLPTKRQESANPVEADESYIAATRLLITHVRDRREDFPLVYEENIAYGYARNLLGLKPIALFLLVISFGLDGYAFYQQGITLSIWLAIGLHLALLVIWVIFIRESWVRRAGTTYAERLFEALDSPRFLSRREDAH